MVPGGPPKQRLSILYKHEFYLNESGFKQKVTKYQKLEFWFSVLVLEFNLLCDEVYASSLLIFGRTNSEVTPIRVEVLRNLKCPVVHVIKTFGLEGCNIKMTSVVGF